MFNVHNSIKNLTRVISSIELDQIMNSPGSIDDFSYIGMNKRKYTYKNKKNAELIC